MAVEFLVAGGVFCLEKLYATRNTQPAQSSPLI